MNKNILFIMVDQLRYGYLSCEGHPSISTPNLDKLAKKGVRFSNAHVQSPVCGPSRMCFYTGRYVSTHGSTWNNVPLCVSEKTLGEYMTDLGVRPLLVGKSHHTPDINGIKRLKFELNDQKINFLKNGGFDVFERDDGIHPDKKVSKDYKYNRYLLDKGFTDFNPWQSYANSVIDENNNIHSGWFLRNIKKPARIPAEHSETAYMTSRAIECIKSQKKPWMVHLSYIKPHWPYVAPSPYHSIYNKNDIIPAIKHKAELENPHPVYNAYLNREESVNFKTEKVRETVIPTYMGMVKHLDDEIGRVLDYLESSNLTKNTLIVFTSDHGDYLGDHWLGDKELFHKQSTQIPLIIFDPSPKADFTRGKEIKEFVSAIDIIPTFIEWLNGDIPEEVLEGESLLPLLHNKKTTKQQYILTELDYSFRKQREDLNIKPHQARAFAIRNFDWLYIYYVGFRSQLFDLKNDPNEFYDLGDDIRYKNVITELKNELLKCIINSKRRTTIKDDEIIKRTESWLDLGIYAGKW